jgi:nitrogen regulatory protein P-II 2
VTEAIGEGSRGRRVGEVPGDNRRIETLVGPDVAQRILDFLAERYFANYALVVWTTDVRVVRGEKYR